MKFLIVCRPVSQVQIWYMTWKNRREQWSSDRAKALQFASVQMAEKYLRAIDHSGIGVEIIPT